MKRLKQSRKRSETAFSRTDLLAVATVMVLGLFLLAGCFPEAREEAQRVKSRSNLKQVGIAFKMFATSHDKRPPMLVSSKNGGAREVFENEKEGQIWKTFAAVSNELGNAPKILADPADEKTVPAETFNERGANNQVLFDGNEHTSYGVGYATRADDFNMIMAGNRHLEGGDSGFSYLNSQIGALGAGDGDVSWAKAVHDGDGNILLGDGSAQTMTTQELNAQLNKSGDPDLKDNPSSANPWAQPGNDGDG